MSSLTEAWLECRTETLESSEIARCMMDTHPEVVDEWLRSTALARLTEWVSDQERRQRMQRHRVFEQKTDQHKAGEFDVFLSAFSRRAPFIAKAQGELRRPDINQILEGYAAEREQSEFYSRVWRKVHRKIGLRRVADVFTEDEFESMFDRPAGAGQRREAQ